MLFWAAVSPLVALKFFLPEYEGEAHLVQFAMRVLEQHPVELVFFYVPQVVQGLRTDELGYVERFIFETAQLSQLFCHQIIWNMKANCYKDDDAEEEDPMKPTFDRMTERIVNSLSGDAKDFYDREFTFFDTVTSISKKLQPYIKKSKAEKKVRRGGLVSAELTSSGQDRRGDRGDQGRQGRLPPVQRRRRRHRHRPQVRSPAPVARQGAVHGHVQDSQGEEAVRR